MDAGELLGIDHVLSADDRGDHRAAGQLESGLDGLGQSHGFRIRSDDEAVDDHLDVVPLLLVEFYLFGQFANLTVYPHPHEPFPPCVFQDGDVFPLHMRHHRRK